MVSANELDFLRCNFNGSVLIDDGDGEHEAEGVVFFDEGSFQALHWSGADANAFADCHFKPWLDLAVAGLGLKEFDFAIGDGCTRVADDAKDTGTAENDAALMIVDADEEVGRKEGALGQDALTIFPDLLDLAGWEEGFDLTAVEEAADRIFALGQGVEGEPTQGGLRRGAERRQRAGEF
jgi:hypothetical protein